MSSAPPERSGMASAMMNALRQTGMTIGIALLGTVMSSRAIRVLAGAVGDQGIANARTVARDAITRHMFPAIPLEFAKFYAAAMTSGFHVAILFAGLACATVAALLLAVQSSAD